VKLAAARPDQDTYVCGDDEQAKHLALELASKVVEGRAIDAGPLAAARALEAMTAVLLNVNRGYKTHAGLRVTGLP
jgi:8-hydroxy-5-deazaflavin:NADPH oxidoreductase